MRTERIIYDLAPCMYCWWHGGPDASMHKSRILKSVKYVTCLSCGEENKLEFESDEALERRNAKRRKKK